MFRILIAVLVRPRLWKVCLRFVPNRWWTYPPYLPVPPKEFREFRLETIYGDKHHPLDKADTLRYLDWCRKA